MNTAIRRHGASASIGATGLLLVILTVAGCFGGPALEPSGSVDGYVFKPVGHAGAQLKVMSRGPGMAPPPGYEPCVGAAVTVTGSTGVAKTDANGYFRKDRVSPGRQTVSIVYEPFRLDVQVVVRSGQVTTVNQATGSLLGKWTVMVYMCADNNLEAAGIADINELEEVGSTSDVNILVQIDRAAGYDKSNEDWTTTRRYYITRDPSVPGSLEYGTIVSPMAPWDRNDTEVNMADPAELRDFVSWCMANYPAQHYILVLWNHGDGWTIWRVPRVVPRAICVDDESGQAMDVDQIRRALEGLPRLSIIGFDACLMQMAEVAYEVRDVADIAVGSEEVEPEGGWDYSEAFAGICANPYATSAWDLARAIVDSYVASYPPEWGVTQSALRLEYSDDIAMAVRALKDELVYRIEQDAGGTDAAQIRQAIKSARLGSREYYGAPYFDLKDFAHNLKACVSDPSFAISRDARVGISAKADALVETLSGPWVYTGGNGNGLSIYLPDRDVWSGVYGYDYLQFEQYTHWSDIFKYVDP